MALGSAALFTMINFVTSIADFNIVYITVSHKLS